jgi:glutathione synthase
MELLVVADPLESLVPASDTSLALAHAAVRRGHRVLHAGAADLTLDGRDLTIRARELAERDGRFAARATEPVAARDLDALLVRVDPPFDTDYLMLTLMLEHARHDTLVVNDPRGLREANEKLYACRFPDLVPATIVTADGARIHAFAQERGGAVVKPLDGHAGRGVRLLRPGDPNLAGIVEDATAFGRRCVEVQEYLPGVAAGDKRILLLDGEPLGAILRVPRPGELRANLVAGATAHATTLDAADRRIVDRLAPQLRADGLWLVGIDVIDGRLTEVNVTSPTGLCQLAHLDGGDPAGRVVDWLAERVRAGARPERAHPNRVTVPTIDSTRSGP